MAETTFLDNVAGAILEHFKDDLLNVTIVLPNRRAKTFLLESLRKKSGATMFSPHITSIELFVQQMANLRAVDNIQLLFDFYDVYLQQSHGEVQDFEQFSNWAKMLLQDFNEIDRYLLDPMHVLTYLKDIEDIKHWSVDAGQKTEMIKKHLAFWDRLPGFYQALYESLLASGKGYQGMIYREAIRNLEHFCKASKHHHYVFAGFNALNAAEERIFQEMQNQEMCTVYWDADETFVNNSYHDAGLFSRKIINGWRHYKTNKFQWIGANFNTEKKIEVIGTPKAVGQAKIAGGIIEQLRADSVSLNNVALVLGDENLLIPVLHSLPADVGALNITMGFPAKQNPAALLVNKLFKMHIGAINRNRSSYVIYYKDLLAVLTSPLVEPFADAKELIEIISERNYTFIPHAKLLELSPDNLFLRLLLRKFDASVENILAQFSEILLAIKHHLDHDSHDDKLTITFLYEISKVINKLVSYCSENVHVTDANHLFQIYKQVIDLAEVSFEGQPLDGLQIMGVLESRVLDFETVIITSMNEGTFPAGKSTSSFIPYDVKRELGLPTYKEKDAIYTYHFYHLLMRAKNIYLLYNTESEGLDGGEMSRFITQLEVEKQPKHSLTHRIYNAEVPELSFEPVIIPKSDAAIARLEEIARRGFSPSALTSYIRNPMDFYLKKILQLGDVEQVEENIALNTLGTIIHKTLEEFYTPIKGKIVTERFINECFARIDTEVASQFRVFYKEGEIVRGKNLLSFEVAKRNVYNFLKLELKRVKEELPIRILDLEQTFERTITDPRLPFPVKIHGNIDRVEQQNGKIRIIDYKTGKVEGTSLCLKEWDELICDIKFDKVFQLLTYAYLMEEINVGKTVEVGIISFKNMKSGFLPFTFVEDRIKTTEITPEISSAFQDQLISLLTNIISREVAFEEAL